MQCVENKQAVFLYGLSLHTAQSWFVKQTALQHYTHTSLAQDSGNHVQTNLTLIQQRFRREAGEEQDSSCKAPNSVSQHSHWAAS